MGIVTNLGADGPSGICGHNLRWRSQLLSYTGLIRLAESGTVAVLYLRERVPELIVVTEHSAWPIAA
jgi:hypothetical protein